MDSVSGSLPNRDLIVLNDPTFAPFCTRFDYEKSLEDAAGFVNGYIEACCSRAALSVDPSCEELGRHIHVATVHRITALTGLSSLRGDFTSRA
jgi:hypothetical protein